MMSINIITEFKTKPGKSNNLIEYLRYLIPTTYEHGGIEEVHIRQNQDDLDDIVSVQRWTSRQAYVDYFQWRAADGVTGQFEELLAAPIVVRYFNEVAMPQPVA